MTCPCEDNELEMCVPCKRTYFCRKCWNNGVWKMVVKYGLCKEHEPRDNPFHAFLKAMGF